MTTALLPMFRSEPLELRNYQRDCIEALRKYGIAGGRRALVALPTGTGKTVIFSQIAGTARKRVLVLAHREELLLQARDKILQAHPGLVVDIEQASKRASPRSQVVVASVQTFAVNRPRLERFAPDSFSAVIIDEAHHATARTYVEVMSHFGLAPSIEDLKMAGLTGRDLSSEVKHRFDGFKPPAGAPFLAGFTATPERSDSQGLEYVFDDMVFSRNIREMMEAGWLVRIRGKRIDTGTDISRVKKRGGDFVESQLSAAVNKDDRNDQVVKAYQDYGENRQTLVFAVDVAHTQALTKAFRQQGFMADFVVGSKREMERPRDEIIAEYKAGKVNVLVNCMVLTEGFDAPETACIIMARPTRSSLLYTQMIGRGTRLAPGKTDLLVIDMVDVAEAGVQNANTMFGLPPRFELGNKDLLQAKKEVEEVESGVPLELFELATSLDDLRQRAAQFDPLAETQVEAWLDTQFAWIRTNYGYALTVPKGQGDEKHPPVQMGVVLDMLEHAEARIKLPGERPEVLARVENVQDAISACEEWINQYRPDATLLLKKGAHWRSEGPTEKQVEFARKLRILIAPEMSRGQVSALIDAKLNKRR